MNDLDLQAQIDAAKAYEALFVPALFGKWATKVADAAQVQLGQRVLDVACGTGVLSREVASRTGPCGYVAGVDPNLGMLAVGQELAPAVDWKQGVAEALPFPDETFDAVVNQFGLMFFSDRRYTGGRRTACTVHTFGDRQALATLFADAGVFTTDITTHTGTAQFSSLFVMVEADLRGWLPVMGVELTEEQIGRILQEAESVFGSYVTAEGRVVFASPAHLVTAVKS